MKKLNSQLNLKISYIPIVGIISFVGLFIYSANLYPGGSQIDPNTNGYDWINNYVCNLMSEKSINGKINPARQSSILGMMLLCMSLIIFFYQFSITFVTNKILKNIIFTGGTLAMISASLIFTKHHDLMTTISSIFGLMAVLVIIKEVYRSNLTSHKITGGICIIMLLINNLIYYTTYKIEYLPTIQKISFMVVLIWIICLNYQIQKRIKDWV